jgi:hypothetical protein
VQEIIESRHGRFAIRSYREGDERKILALWQAAFGREMAPRLWSWKYLENPYGHQILLCESEAGQVVAMYAGVPYRANFQGETVRITHLTDNMSHPAYRGPIGGKKGLFVRTVLAFFDRYGGPHASIYLYGFPGERHFRLGERLLEYRALSGGVRFMTATTTDLAQGIIPFAGKIDRISVCDASFDRLAEASRRFYPFSIMRDSAFLRWRFLEHPANHYELFGYRSLMRKRLRGYTVLSLLGDQARLVDFLMPLSKKSLRDFLARLAVSLSRCGIQRVEAWLPEGHFTVGMLASAGFVPAQEPLGIIPTGRTFYARLSWEWAAKNLFYTMADGDLF